MQINHYCALSNVSRPVSFYPGFLCEFYCFVLFTVHVPVQGCSRELTCMCATASHPVSVQTSSLFIAFSYYIHYIAKQLFVIEMYYLFRILFRHH